MTYISIQGLRGIAAMLVVMHHYNGLYGQLLKHGRSELPWMLAIGNMNLFGAIGVPIFFVISGFVIAQQALKTNPDSLPVFLAKRISRIVPIYWIVTLVFVVATGGVFDEKLLRSLLFVATDPGSNPLVGPGWSLEYEMYFYLMFGGLVLSGVASSPSAGVVLLSFIFAFTVITGHLTGSPYFHKIGDPVILEFLGGIAIAYLTRVPWVIRYGWIYLALGLCLATASALKNGSWVEIRSLWSVGSFCIVLGLVSLELGGKVLLRSRPLQTLGEASYSIYLTHVPLMMIAFPVPVWRWNLPSFVDPHIGLLSLMFVAAVAGIAVHYWIEITAWHHARAALLRLTDRRPGPASQAAPVGPAPPGICSLIDRMKRPCSCAKRAAIGSNCSRTNSVLP
jgi:exopolysaccharide production protein ExoZ